MTTTAASTGLLPSNWALASLLIARYNDLALTHAASRATQAESSGDRELAVIWHDVVNYLRHSR
ncbi:MAG: hypothetical protein GC131_01495 [Alphaproteobacteria bacterium]|nr:hypothetical protein [Alphaproteobacteria bacterium]